MYYELVKPDKTVMIKYYTHHLQTSSIEDELKEKNMVIYWLSKP